MNKKEIKIGDFLKRIKRPIELEDKKEYKLVTVKLHHNGVILREIKKGSEIKSKMYEVKSGDFILSGIDARNGAFGIVPEELDGATVTNDFWYFEIDENIIDKHFFLELTATEWFDEICKKGSDGTTQRIRLQKDKFFDQIINLPSRSEQDLLLGVFKSRKNLIDKLSSHLSGNLELLPLLRQQILQDAITGKLSEKWREENPNLEPAEKLLEKIKAEKQKMVKEGASTGSTRAKKQKPSPPIEESEIPFDLPEEWVWFRLGEISIQTGSGSTPKGGKEVYTDSGIPFIRSQNVYDSGLVLQNVAYIAEEIHEQMKHTQLQPYDILLNITGGSIGRACIIPKDFNSGNINQHVSIIRLSFLLETKFIHNVILSTYFQQEIFKNTTGAGRQGLQKYKMDEMLIPLPPLTEQQYIVERIESLFAKLYRIKELNTQNQETINLLNKEVLKEMFEK